MGVEIHASAIVSPREKIAKGVQIGTFSTIGENVTIGRDTIIGSHVVIDGNTVLGERNKVFPFVSGTNR